MGSSGVLRDLDSARDSRRRDRALGDRNGYLRAARPLPEPSAHRAMDLAPLDVRLRHRRDRVSHALSVLYADLLTVCTRRRRNRRSIKKGRLRRTPFERIPDFYRYAFALGRLDTA